jgi:hypothetical protein
MAIRPRVQRAVVSDAGPQLLRVNVATYIPSGMHGIEDSYISEGWRTADLIPTGMHGLGAVASGTAGAVLAKMIRAGMSPERARVILSRATARLARRPVALPARRLAPANPTRISGGLLKGMGAAGDADPAGQSWLDRTTQITLEWKDPTYDKSQAHSEAQIAMQGISALLQNRFADLSDTMVQSLYQADDALDQVQKDTLSASYQSPWAAGAVAFGQQVSSEVQAGAAALSKAAQTAVNIATTPLTYYVGAGVAALVGAKMLHLI